MGHTAREDKEEWPMAEILSIRQLQNGCKQYYVHFLDYNKRLDEWVSEDRLNFSHVEPPKPKDNDSKTSNLNSTPKRSASASAAPSRPSTPPGMCQYTFGKLILAKEQIYSTLKARFSTSQSVNLR